MDKRITDLSKKRLFASSQILQAVNITYRQLSYWQLKGLVKPTYQRLGTRDFKRYTQQDIDTLKTVKRLLDEGYSLPATDTLEEIAKRKEAEEKIEQIAREWMTTFNSIEDLVWVQDKDFKLVRVNKAFADTFKMKPEELIGKNCYEIVHRRKEPWPNCPHKRTLETKKSVMEEIFEPYLGIDLEISTSPIFNKKGEVTGAVHIVKNITERKKVEIALQESEKQFQLLYERAPVGYQSLNEDGYFIAVNQTWVDMLGYLREEVIGRWFGDFIVPEHRDHFKKNFPRFKAAGEIHDVEFKMLRKDGTIMHVIFDGTIIYDNRGRFKQTHCSMRNITKRKQAEETLREARVFSDSLIASMQDGFSVLDNHGVHIDVNPAFCRITGLRVKYVRVTFFIFEEVSFIITRSCYAPIP